MDKVIMLLGAAEKAAITFDAKRRGARYLIAFMTLSLLILLTILYILK